MVTKPLGTPEIMGLTTDQSSIIHIYSYSFLTFCYVFSFRPLHEIFHLWTLAGGDLEGELKKCGLIKAKPPIMSLPMYVF